MRESHYSVALQSDLTLYRETGVFDKNRHICETVRCHSMMAASAMSDRRCVRGR